MPWDQLPDLEDDGLYTPIVGPWSEDKYRLVATYAEIFSTAMKDRWPKRTFIDLFSGSGRSRIRETKRIVPGSPLLALEVDDPFDEYFFCDMDAACVDALRQRCERTAPELSVHVLEGDCNIVVDDIVEQIGGLPRAKSVLSFALLDPFSVDNFKFASIEKLAGLGAVDFLILIPSFMDAHRNVWNGYYRAGNTKVEDFLGDPEWRDAWRGSTQPFGVFFLSRFSASMKRLGFIYDGLGNEVLIQDGQRRLYHLTFFSRHPLAMKFWNQARKYSTPQLPLFKET